MGSFNSNILPATTGLTLGNQNQQWLAYLSNVFASTVQTQAANPALSGLLRLASTDTIAWRNNANTTDIVLSKTGAAASNVPADTLSFAGSIKAASFLSSTANPATTGAVRLASADVFEFRNNANTNDIAGLTHNSDDTVTVGGSAGQKQSFILSASATPATAGVLRLANNTDAINWRNAANSADVGLSVDNANHLVSAVDAGVWLTGAIPAVILGPTLNTSFPMIKRSTPTVGIAIRTADNSLDADMTLGRFTGINGIVPAANTSGVPVYVKTLTLTGQSAAIGTTTLYTAVTPTVGNLLYRVTWYARVQTAAGVSSTLGALTLSYTDGGVVQTITCGAMIAAGTIATTSTGNTTATVLSGLPVTFSADTGTNITYAFGYASNAANAMNYGLSIRVEAL